MWLALLKSITSLEINKTKTTQFVLGYTVMFLWKYYADFRCDVTVSYDLQLQCITGTVRHCTAGTTLTNAADTGSTQSNYVTSSEPVN